MGILNTLVDTRGSCSVTGLAKTVQADVLLTGELLRTIEELLSSQFCKDRIARYLAAHGMVEQVDDTSYKANNITKTLSVEGFQAGMNHWYVQN